MSLSQVQQLAAQTVAAVAAGKNLSDELDSIFAEHPELSPQDKGMLQDIAYGVQRYAGSLKYMLGKMLDKPLARHDVANLLTVALYQLRHTRNAPHAVVNEAVENVARIGSQYKSFANAVLRRFLREKDKLAAECKHDDTARYNIPAWLQACLKRQHPRHWRSIVTAFQHKPPLTLRVNPRKTTPEQYIAELQAAGIAAEWLDGAAIRIGEPVAVSALPRFAEGHASVQDYGAQQAAYILNPQNGERILDACAAPGGKTGHILELADCNVTALDIDPVRLARVQSNLDRLGFQAALHAADAKDLDAWYDGNPFDAILADIPCTASGTIKRNPDIKWLRRPSDPLQTARQQEALLDALWQMLKTGGRMLLATCSLFEEENQRQCQKFLSRHVSARLISETLILPSEKQDGFYYALIGKE